MKTFAGWLMTSRLYHKIMIGLIAAALLLMWLGRSAALAREKKIQSESECRAHNSISQVAIEAGFAHQSHLALHMKRLLGLSPSQAIRSAQ